MNGKQTLCSAQRLSITLIIAIGVASLLFYPPRAVVATATTWGGADFTYCILFLTGWWNGEITNPYNYDQQRQLLEQVYRYHGAIIMPFPWSPSSAILLYPFYLLKDTALAAVAWNFVTFSFFLGCIIMWVRRSDSDLRNLGVRTLLGSMMASSTFAAQTLSLGQTSFLGAGGLGMILLATDKRSRSPHTARSIASTILMSLKPTYLLSALGLLFTRRQWRTLFGCGVAFAALGVSLAAIFPMHVWGDWLQQVKFHSDPIDLRYRSPGTVYGYDQSAVIRNVLTMWFPGEVAHRICSSLFFLSFIAIVCRTVLKQHTEDAKDGLQLLATFLLIIPYLGFHDELLVFPLLVSAGIYRDRCNSLHIWLILASVALLCYAPLLPLQRLATKLILLVTLYQLSSNCHEQNAAV